MGKYDKYLQEDEKKSKYSDIIDKYVEKPKPKTGIAKVLEDTGLGKLANTYKKTLQGFWEITQWAITGTIRDVGNIGSFVTRHGGSGLDWVLPWQPVKNFMGWVADKFKSWADKLASMTEQGSQKVLWLDPNSWQSNVWQFLPALAATIWTEWAAAQTMSPALLKLTSQFPKLAALIENSPKLAKVGNYIGNVAKSYLWGQGFDVANKWQTDTSLGSNANISAWLTAVMPPLAKLALWIGKVSGIISKSGDAPLEAFNAARKGGEEARILKEGLAGRISWDEILAQAKEGMDSLRTQKRAIYGKWYDAFQKMSNKIGDIDNTDIYKSFANKLKEFKVNVPDNLPELWKWTKDKWELLQQMFANSSITRKSPIIQEVGEILDDLSSGFGKTTLDNLDTFKHRLSGRIEQSGTHPILSELKKSVTDKIMKSDTSGMYRKMSEDYNKATEIMNDISAALKPDGNKAIAINKLLSWFRDSSKFRQQALEELEKYTGVKLKPAIAGVAWQKWLNPSGNTLASGAGIGWLATSGMLPQALLLLGASSPKVVMRTAQALGISARRLQQAIDVWNKILWKWAVQSATRNIAAEWASNVVQ